MPEQQTAATPPSQKSPNTPNTPSDDPKTISFRLPGNVSRAVETRARERGETVSDLIRRALETELWPPSPPPIVYMAGAIVNGSVAFHLGPGLSPGGYFLGPAIRWEAPGLAASVDIWVGRPAAQPQLPLTGLIGDALRPTPEGIRNVG
jgi:hypothetical protein